jgi:glycosyltransferase involved in cell wall biosynthesis
VVCRWSNRVAAEIVENTGGGLLVAPDDPQSLADGILKIYQNKAYAEELSANGFHGVRAHYTAAHMADKVLEAYSICKGSLQATI